MGRSRHYFTPTGDLYAEVRAYLLKGNDGPIVRLSTHWDVADLPLPVTVASIEEGLALALAGRPVRETGDDKATPPWVEDLEDMGLPERNPAWLAILGRWAEEIHDRYGG